MNSPILELIGIDPAIIIGVLIAFIILLLILLLVTNGKIKDTNRKLDAFMRGKDAESLEGTMMDIIDEVERLSQNDIQKRREIKRINDNLMICFQKMGIVKYDAFGEMGGKLSFALCLLDKNNNGYIINSMQAREGCYTYIKEIVKGESYILLGEEERQALAKAIDEEDLMEDLKEFKSLDERKAEEKPEKEVRYNTAKESGIKPERRDTGKSKKKKKKAVEDDEEYFDDIDEVEVEVYDDYDE